MNLGEGSKFHTETLWINELSIGETCEGFFRTFLFKNFIDNTCYIRKIFTFGEIIFLLERCIVKKKTYLCECPAREMARHIQESVFCFILKTKSPISNWKDRDNSNAHSVYSYIMLKGQSMLYSDALYIFQCENIVSSFIFSEAFGDACFQWAGQVSHFLFIVTLV